MGPIRPASVSSATISIGIISYKSFLLKPGSEAASQDKGGGVPLSAMAMEAKNKNTVVIRIYK
jgi:hypothetical protein